MPLTYDTGSTLSNIYNVQHTRSDPPLQKTQSAATIPFPEQTASRGQTTIPLPPLPNSVTRTLKGGKKRAITKSPEVTQFVNPSATLPRYAATTYNDTRSPIYIINRDGHLLPHSTPDGPFTTIYLRHGGALHYRVAPELLVQGQFDDVEEEGGGTAEIQVRSLVKLQNT